MPHESGTDKSDLRQPKARRSQNPIVKNRNESFAELYTKLLRLLIQHWIVLNRLWRWLHRSLAKGYQMIKEQSNMAARSTPGKRSLILHND